MKIETYNKAINDFIRDLDLCTSYYNIKLILTLQPYVNLGMDEKTKCNGYFDDVSEVIAVATSKPIEQWFPTLVHESCHFDQWRYFTKVWSDYSNNSCSDNKLDDILTGKLVLSENDNKEYFRISRELELDCERRTINKIKEYNLPIDIKKYAKGAASYVLFYNYVEKYKKWYVMGREPYNTESILKEMPESLDGDFSKLEPHIESMFKGCVSNES